jgi:hypothetical protein
MKSKCQWLFEAVSFGIVMVSVTVVLWFGYLAMLGCLQTAMVNVHKKLVAVRT